MSVVRERLMNVSSIILETERLSLRRWLPSDLTPFAALNGDPRVMEHFPSTYTLAQTRDMIDRIEGGIDQHGFGFWALEEKASGDFVGFTGLSVPDGLPFSPCVEVGWRLAFEHWGKGYAQEAARAALDFGFRAKQLTEIVSFTAVGNVRSRRVMEAIGMTLDCEFEHPRVAEGHPLRRHVLYRIATPAPQKNRSETGDRRQETGDRRFSDVLVSHALENVRSGANRRCPRPRATSEVTLRHLLSPVERRERGETS